MKNLILTCLFLLVALCIIDSCVWHKASADIPCTVVFKSEPTVSRGGYPYYYVEIRRDDNNAWSQQSVTGEFYANLNKGDKVNFTLYDSGVEILHALGVFFGVVAFIVVAVIMPGKPEIKE